MSGTSRTGQLVVNASVAQDIVRVFARLFEARFPIAKMELIPSVVGSDAANNTSGYQCRYIGGTDSLSMHAYGLAVDVNPVFNPWVSGGEVIPGAGLPYVDRAKKVPGGIYGGGPVNEAFGSIGWGWGASYGDYMHFSTTGG